jgi:hypothetical protein
MGERLGQMLLYRATRDPELLADFGEGVAVTALKHEDRSRAGWKARECVIQGLETAFEMDTSNRIGVGREVLIEQCIEGVHRLGHPHARQTVLMDDVAGNGEQIRFGIADLLESFNTQKSQEHFLGKICRIRVVSQTRCEKTPQALTMFRSDIGDKILLGPGNQFRSVGGPVRALE